MGDGGVDEALIAMVIDEATLTTVLGLASLSASAVFFALSAFARHIPGVRAWGIGCLAIGAAMVLDGPRVIEDWRIASVVFNIPFSIGHAFILAGTMQFCARPGARPVLWFFCILGVCTTLLFTFAVPEARWRIPLLSAQQGAINLWTALILWRYADQFSRRVFIIAGLTALIQAGAALVQAWLIAVSPVTPTYGAPELPLANIIIWGGALTNTLVGNAMLCLLVMARLVAELRSAAERDMLTGLLNRRGLRLHFDALLERTGGHPGVLGVMILDIDHFKAVNDAHGHDAGDRVLKAMGEVLLRTGVAGAAAARWGGEEFCVVVEGPDRETLLQLAEQIRAAFQRATALMPELPKGKTVSIGVALALLDARFDISSVISRADAQLYRAKEGGRDRVAIAD
jgi:diguanylate cyclase (GGDEF)-like protein